jgi:hypothetical protein
LPVALDASRAQDLVPRTPRLTASRATRPGTKKVDRRGCSRWRRPFLQTRSRTLRSGAAPPPAELPTGCLDVLGAHTLMAAPQPHSEFCDQLRSRPDWAKPARNPPRVERGQGAVSTSPSKYRRVSATSTNSTTRRVVLSLTGRCLRPPSIPPTTGSSRIRWARPATLLTCSCWSGNPPCEASRPVSQAHWPKRGHFSHPSGSDRE